MGTPPDIGGDTSGSVEEDSGLLVTGDLDDVSGNTAADTWTIQSGATYGTASIDPTTGVWTYDLDDTNAVVDALDAGETLTDTFRVRLSDSRGNDTETVTITITGVPCFMVGTRIKTANGLQAVETIGAGDTVHTDDCGLQDVRWVGRRKVSHSEMVCDERLRPIRIAKGAFGDGLPLRDLLVSRQHRILVRGACVQHLFGVDEVLLSAVRLLGFKGVDVVLPEADIEFCHILFDRHQVVFAEGVALESLLFGKQTRQSLAWRSVAEITSLFPSAADQTGLSLPARPIPDMRAQKQFARHWRPEHGPFIKAFEGQYHMDIAASE
ncbi:Hint domain-containing protein [Rhodophyticola sp. CCM32]|uniref:Hint domain-containing protein n=1 Tax=Rhodophyticola sp. CCM32 TaxID=2916397 RepID=UPI00143CCCBF|nr:Hint domain-containing protein [Rhodophyticola sp. CCM32]